VIDETLPAFVGVRSAEDVAKFAEEFGKTGDPYVQQIYAYAWARAGDKLRADLELQRLSRVLDDGIPWQREMADRAEFLRRTLVAEPASAQQLLDNWELETLRRLSLETLSQ
jgi:hypothetical protein